MVDKRTNADLTSFALDDRHRKIFIGDTYGSIRVYNISNGVFIKHVDNIFQKEEEESENEDKETLENKIDNIDKSKEVSNLKFISIDTSYFGNVKMLVTTSWDSSLQVYDESESDSRLLRKAIGGCGQEDILCLEVSEHLSLIATGSSGGSVVVWDFEMS